jgi:lipopolysaccharide transport system ATP-binding protein
MIRVGMVGTFDVANFDDLLFPLVAKAELRRRLGDVEIHPYSCHARSAPSWPFHVTPLERLPEDVETLDLLLVGSGDIILQVSGPRRSWSRTSPSYRTRTPTWWL